MDIKSLSLPLKQALGLEDLIPNNWRCEVNVQELTRIELPCEHSHSEANWFYFIVE